MSNTRKMAFGWSIILLLNMLSSSVFAVSSNDLEIVVDDSKERGKIYTPAEEFKKVEISNHFSCSVFFQIEIRVLFVEISVEKTVLKVG